MLTSRSSREEWDIINILGIFSFAIMPRHVSSSHLLLAEQYTQEDIRVVHMAVVVVDMTEDVVGDMDYVLAVAERIPGSW